MWIVKQNKMGIVNTDHIVVLSILHHTNSICASTSSDDTITLGQYKDIDTCKKVMDLILLAEKSMLTEFDMPLGGDV